MTTYKGKPAVVDTPADQLFSRFSDLSNLQAALNNLPAEELAKVGELRFDRDSLTMVTPQVGEIKFQVIERQAPGKVVFSAVGSPLPITMAINFKPLSDASTEVVTAIELDIPAVMKPFVGPKLQQAADRFGELMGTLGR